MAKKTSSELLELFKLLRRIIVLAVAAYGLARGMPYVPLAVRLAILWAVLYICSGLMDVVYRRLHFRAAWQAPRAAAPLSTAVTNRPGNA
jgi:hypothetical protein